MKSLKNLYGAAKVRFLGGREYQEDRAIEKYRFFNSLSKDMPKDEIKSLMILEGVFEDKVNDIRDPYTNSFGPG